jgi:hypothetical protein
MIDGDFSWCSYFNSTNFLFSQVLMHSLCVSFLLLLIIPSPLLATTFTPASVQIPFDSCHFLCFVYAGISSKQNRHVTQLNALLLRCCESPKCPEFGSGSAKVADLLLLRMLEILMQILPQSMPLTVQKRVHDGIWGRMFY